jgi:hypothetical protein
VKVGWRLYAEAQPQGLGMEGLEKFVRFQGTRFRERKALRTSFVHEV